MLLHTLFVRFADCTKLRGDTKGRTAIQKDLNSMKERASRSPLKFKRDKCRDLHPGRRNSLK